MISTWPILYVDICIRSSRTILDSHALFNGMFTPIDSRLVIAIPDKVPGFNVIIFIPKCSIVLLRYISVMCDVRVLNSVRCPHSSCGMVLL